MQPEAGGRLAKTHGGTSVLLSPVAVIARGRVSVEGTPSEGGAPECTRGRLDTWVRRRQGQVPEAMSQAYTQGRVVAAGVGSAPSAGRISPEWERQVDRQAAVRQTEGLRGTDSRRRAGASFKTEFTTKLEI